MEFARFSETFDWAVQALNEIAGRTPFELSGELLKISDAGHKLFTAKVFDVPTMDATRFGVLYEPSEELLRCLAAFGANRVEFETAGRAVHDRSPPQA